MKEKAGSNLLHESIYQNQEIIVVFQYIVIAGMVKIFEIARLFKDGNLLITRGKLYMSAF